MPRPPKKSCIDIALIGAGTLGTALATQLRKRGYRITKIISRDDARSLRRARNLANHVGAEAEAISTAEFGAKLVWICVPDDAVSLVAHELAGRGDWLRKVVIHSSGALVSGVLNPLKQAGAEIASAHPLMTFVSACKTELTGVPFAIEGDPKALTIVGALVRSLGARPFRIAAESKPAYHLLGFFSSPALVAVIAAAQQVGALAGFSRIRSRELIEPIVRQTIANCFGNGPETAFSGPLRRGDAATIRKHLSVLNKEPELLALYRTLCRIALEQLPVRNREQLRKLID